jgi:hypothetical protein
MLGIRVFHNGPSSLPVITTKEGVTLTTDRGLPQLPLDRRLRLVSQSG